MSRPRGCRSHLLVLPSVVCATRVAADIAEALGGVTITHQHGCSQVGDDGVRTRDAFEQIACNPNVAAALVVGLGCETVQGAALAAGIARRGQRVEFNGIQEQGGSRACVASGVLTGGRLLEEATAAGSTPPALAETAIGIEASHASPLAAALVGRALAEGATVVIGGAPDAPSGSAALAAFGPPAAAGAATLLSGAGSGAQQHVALAAAGAQVIVAFPALDDAPVGFPVCPVIAVAGSSPLHAALGDDFDLPADATIDALWSLVLAVLAGTETAAELRGSRVFALERLAMSM
jgi:altronate dehydratase large subunit